MRADKNIGVIELVVGGEYFPSEKYPHLVEMPKKSEYRINCQAAIWRKSFLIKLLRSFESPWEFEKYGSIRNRRYKEKIYAWANEEDSIFVYSWGKLILCGKWCTDELFRIEKKLGIKFDYAGRPLDSFKNIRAVPKPKHNLKWFFGKLKHVKSLF